MSRRHPLGGDDLVAEPPRKASPLASFSVVIPNYNYGHFITDAVSSALAIDWPEVEVIVVDDGSTDDSVEVLERFAGQITVLQQENAGPREACNRGFAASSGDIVIFLDSDDQVEPSIAREVMEVWRPGLSKVQVQMQRVDSSGALAGGVFPEFESAPSPAQLREWITRTGAYPTPPGSGNVYSRAFLDRLLPLGDVCGDATDSACLAAAPYLGDVVTIVKPLVRYRIHSDNRSKLTDPVRFTRQIQRAYQRQRFALEVSGRSTAEAEVVRPLRQGRHLLQMRIAERRLNSGAAPLPGDSRTKMLVDIPRSILAPGPEGLGHRLMVSLWSLATLAAPPFLARRLIGRRF